MAVVVEVEDGVVAVEVEIEDDGVVVFRFPYHISYMRLPRTAQVVVQNVNILLLLAVQKRFWLEEAAGIWYHHFQHIHMARCLCDSNQAEEWVKTTLA